MFSVVSVSQSFILKRVWLVSGGGGGLASYWNAFLFSLYCILVVVRKNHFFHTLSKNNRSSSSNLKLIATRKYSSRMSSTCGCGGRGSVMRVGVIAGPMFRRGIPGLLHRGILPFDTPTRLPLDIPIPRHNHFLPGHTNPSPDIPTPSLWTHPPKVTWDQEGIPPSGE